MIMIFRAGKIICDMGKLSESLSISQYKLIVLLNELIAASSARYISRNKLTGLSDKGE